MILLKNMNFKFIFIHSVKSQIILISEKVLKEYDDEAHIAEERRTVSYRQIWKAHSLRYPFLICILAAIAKSFSGEAIGSQYSNVIVQSLGKHALISNSAVEFTAIVVFIVIVMAVIMRS